jgi:hypothetical protein
VGIPEIRILEDEDSLKTVRFQQMKKTEISLFPCDFQSLTPKRSLPQKNERFSEVRFLFRVFNFSRHRSEVPGSYCSNIAVFS